MPIYFRLKKSENLPKKKKIVKNVKNKNKNNLKN